MVFVNQIKCIGVPVSFMKIIPNIPIYNCFFLQEFSDPAPRKAKKAKAKEEKMTKEEMTLTKVIRLGKSIAVVYSLRTN